MSALPRSLLAAVALAALLAPSVAPRPAGAAEPAMKPEARAHLERGLAAYGAKDWAAAIREFREGYALDPRPDFLFAWAQASRLSGDCAHAVELYDQFVATGPAPEQRDAAQKMGDRCRETLAAETPAPEPAPATPAPAPEPTPTPTPRGEETEQAWWKDGWGAGLTTAGLVGLGAGIGLSMAASSSDDAATRADSYDDFVHLKDQGASRRTFAAVSFAAGGALLVGGVIRYVMVQHHQREAHTPALAVSVAPGAASLWVAGRF